MPTDIKTRRAGRDDVGIKSRHNGRIKGRMVFCELGRLLYLCVCNKLIVFVLSNHTTDGGTEAICVSLCVRAGGGFD